MKTKQQSFSSSRCGESGASLINLMVGVAVSILAVFGAQRLIVKGMNSSKNLQMGSDLAEMRVNFVKIIDCAATTAGMGGVCKPGKAIEVKSTAPGNPVIIAKPVLSKQGGGTTYQTQGVYSLKASCENCASGCSNGHKIVIKYAVIDGDNQFKQDALTGKTLDWKGGGDLFDGIPVPCEVPF